jgi:hypothetical protein
VPGGRGNGQATYFMPNLVSTTSYKGQSINAPYPYQNYPYVQQWNAALSHQFKGDWMAEISYSGLSGKNLPGIGHNLDEIPNQYDSMQSSLGTHQACAATPGITSGSPGGFISAGQCLRPYPLYNNVQDGAQLYAVQHYRSIQARAEKRMGIAGVLTGNYTWARNIGNTDTTASYLESKSSVQGGSGNGGLQDYNNLTGEISLISYDVTNRAIVSYVVSLPFGKGAKYGNSFSGPMNAIVSGWAINGITTLQSGFPVFLGNSSGNQLNQSYGAGGTRPMVISGCNPKIGGSGLARAKNGAWFNTNCFAAQGQNFLPNGSYSPFNPNGPGGSANLQYYNGFAFGNEPRVDPTLRGDGIKNFDFSFQKSTPIHESTNFEFRAEFFNVMNRVQFSPPNASVGSNQFGTIAYQVNKPRQIQLSARVNF